MDHVTRTLHIKKLRFKSGRDKEFKAPSIEELLLDVDAHTSLLKERHFPPIKDLTAGITCSYITNIKRRAGGDKRGVSFEVGVYTHGVETDQLSLGDDTTDPVIESGRIVGKDGKPREILHRYWCVALGETVLIDYVRSSGGYAKLTPMLDFLFRYRSGRNQPLPATELLDVAAPSFQAAVEAGGGIAKVTLRMVEAIPAGKRMKFGRMLSELRAELTGARRLTVEWDTGDEKIDPVHVEKIYQEFKRDDSPIQEFIVKLKDGADLTGATRFHEKQEIQVQITPEGKVASTEILEGLWNYLDKLRTPTGTWRMLDDDGYVIRAPSKKKR